MNIGQAVAVGTIEDGTQINFIVANGRLFRVGTDLATLEDVTPANVTIDANERAYVTPFSNRLAINDNVNTPWIASELLASPVVGTKIDYQSDGSAWKAYGPAVIFGDSIFWIVRERNQEGVNAGTPEKRTSRIAWTEADDPLTGYHQTTFDNEWDLIQNGVTPVNALWGTNLALEYFREQSIGYLTGTVGPDLRTTATHDSIDESTGTRAPASLASFGDRTFFVDVEGRVTMLKTGAGLTQIWLQHRRVVDAAKTRFPDITARTACGVIVPELDLYLVVIWSPDPTNAALVFPTTMYAFRADSGIYVSEWTIGPFGGDKVAVHSMGTLIGPNGGPRLIVLGKPSLAAADDPVGIYVLFALDDEIWNDDDELPDIMYQTARLGYSAGRIINADQVTVIVRTVPQATEEDTDVPRTLTISPTTLSLADGATRQLTALVRNAQGTVLVGVPVTWSSDNTAAAAVSLTGVVTRGTGTGVAHIHASTGNLVSNACTVSAVAPSEDLTPASITLTPSTASIAQDETAQLVAVVRNAAGKVLVGVALTWASDDTGVVAVSVTGVISGTSVAGTALVTASASGVTSNACTVANEGPIISIVPASITISPTTVSLEEGQQRQLAAIIRDISNNILALTPDGWTTDDDSLAAVSPLGLVTAIAEGGPVTIRARIGSIFSNPCVVTVDALPAVPDAVALIKAHLGPMIDVADVPPELSWYETLWAQYAEAQWNPDPDDPTHNLTGFGAKWDAGNSIAGYDRASIYYAWYARTLNPVYLQRAHALVIDYRDKYVLATEDFAIVAHWIQADGLYLHWLLTGDTASRDAVLGIANKYIGYTLGYLTNLGNPDLDARIQSRVIEIMWMAEKIQPMAGWTALLDTAIAQSLSVLNSDGYAPFTGACGGSVNFQQGLLYDTLARIYDQRGPNADILTAITNYATWAWSTQWRGTANPADKSFNYLSVLCFNPNGGGSPTSAPDLNGLMAPLFGWLGVTLSDPTYFDKGDLVIEGMQQASLYLYRQFSESFRSSYRYLGYRYP